MREIVNKYIDEIDSLTSKALDLEGNFINPYDKEIINIMYSYKDKLLNEINIKNLKRDKNYRLINLEILYYLLDESGLRHANNEINKEIEKWKTEAKNRLFMIYVKNLNEVIYLLKGGFASAALGRVRAIYETCVFYEIVSNNDDSFSEKFLKHSNSSRFKIASSLSDNELKKRIKKQILDLEYGEEFYKEYQWAREIINKKRITFYDLASITSLSDFYHLYVFSCLSVHSNIYSTLNGIETKKEERNKGIWNTTPSDEGIDGVINILLLISSNIMTKHFEDSKCLVHPLIIFVFEEISKDH